MFDIGKLQNAVIEVTVSFAFDVLNCSSPNNKGTPCHVGIQRVCEVGLKKHLSFDFGETKEFCLLKQHVVSVRNKIVHGTRLEMITKIECEAAIEATMNATNYFTEKIKRFPIRESS